MGIKTWEYLQSSIRNAAIPSRTCTDYLEQLCKKLVVSHLSPKVFSKIVNPEQIIWRVNLNPDGTTGEQQALDTDQNNLKWLGWEEILQSLAPQGITERHIIEQCKKYPHVLTALIRLRHEELKALGLKEEEEEVTLDV